MCGLLGYISRKTTEMPKWFIDGCHELNHRGPDANGFWNSNDQKVFFGHTRLSVIDLSEKASQPMLDKENGNVIIFNGEIYNFREIKNELIKLKCNFKTESDTEVLLACYKVWGKDFLQKIDGMFSISIYDKLKNLVLLARDRFGQKPLYYIENENELRFSSQIKPLLLDPKVNREVDANSLSNLLTFGFIKEHNSLIKNIKKIAPGSFLIFNLNSKNSTKEQKYWSLDDNFNFEKNNYSIKEHVKNIDNIFQKNFKNFLISDVPLCILSSGGVDSSIITAYAAKFSNNVNTFHVKLSDGSNSEDSENAKLVSKYFKTRHEEIVIDYNNSINFEKIFCSFDDPIFDSSIIPSYLISEQISKKYKVAIGGDGGDELFGGYNKYQFLKIFNLLQKILPKSFLNLLSFIYGERSKKYFKNRDIFSILKNDLLNEKFQYQYFTDSINFLNDKKLEQILRDKFKNIKYKENKGNLVDSLIYDDLKSYLPNDILHKVDTCSMANSLEIRAPFLNNDLSNYTLKYLHTDHKVTLNSKKIVLKKLAQELLPKNFNFNRKLGFSIPLNTWLRAGSFRNYAYDILISSSSFSKKSINQLFKLLDNGNLVGDKIFSLLILETWLKNYKVNLGNQI